MSQARTDMAREAFTECADIAGVSESTERIDGVEISRIRVETAEAAKRLGKPLGQYITLEATGDMAMQGETLSACVADELRALLKDVPGHILVVGLGNREVTPDSLGPRTVEKLFVTRHILDFLPELAPSGMREVSAIVPGVLGVTGLKTAEVVQGVVENVRPAAVLCIDALCSQRAGRIAQVVQINDSGLLPGAGVGNRQQGLNQETLGVPVYAIGVPTVVYASVIAAETVHLIEKQTGVADSGNSLSALAGELIEQNMGDLIVTPKDVDQLVEDASKRLANGINRALHGKNYQELAQLMSN